MDILLKYSGGSSCSSDRPALEVHELSPSGHVIIEWLRASQCSFSTSLWQELHLMSVANADVQGKKMDTFST